MTTRADYTPEEWSLLRQAPTMAALTAVAEALGDHGLEARPSLR
jgi:hypothetical protein